MPSVNASSGPGFVERKDIFISHAGDDEQVVQRLAMGLEREGFTTWYYERDNTFGEPHLVQTKRAIERAKVVVLLASPNSVRSHEVTTELQAAHGNAKPVAPLLLRLTWSEMKERSNELWSIILGAATALTLDPNNVTDTLPRIIAGLTAMGVAPSGAGSVVKSIASEYPLPIAATYVQKLGRPWGPEQAVQAYEALKDLLEAVIAYLAVLIVCRYRQVLGASASEDAALELALDNLREPGLADWAQLLFTALRAQVLAGDELVWHLSRFVNSRRDENDALSAAATRLREWIGDNVPGNQFLTNGDFMELLSTYAQVPQGGWKSGTRLSDRDECQRRINLLRPAVERMLLDLSFLTAYPLIYVQEGTQAPDGTWSQQVCDATGRDVTVRKEPLKSPKPLERSHTYLCHYQGKVLQPWVDLDPLLVFQDCPTCGVPSILLASLGRSGRAEGVNPSCRHRTDWDEKRSQHLAAFLSLSEWRKGFMRADFLPYTAALEEVMSEACQISPEDRHKVAFLAKALRIPHEVAEQLEHQVIARRRQEIAEKAQQERAKRQDERKTAEDPLEPQPAGQSVPAGAEQVSPAAPAKRLIQLWRENLGAYPTHVALFGTPPFAFVVDQAGTVSVFARDGKLAFRDRLQGRPFAAATGADRVFTSTWSGGLYCIGPRELLWHRHFESPVSALHVAHPLGVVAGTWDGRVVLLREEDGAEIWSASLSDGISALTTAPDGSAFYVGSYAGHLIRLDAAGRKEWMRDGPAGIVQINVNSEAEILAATRNGSLTCLDACTQETVWERFLEGPLAGISFSGNRRQVALALRSGKLQVCGIDGGLHLRAERKLEDLRNTIFSALSPGGRFLAVASQSDGLLLFDEQEAVWTAEAEPPVLCASFSADGRFVLAGSRSHVDALRLAAPALATRLVPLGEVRKGSFTRLRITIDNSGERPARDISVEFSGPIEGRPFSLAQDLRPGERVIQENHSVQPKEEGAVPVRVRLSCCDDQGVPYVFDAEHVLDVGRISTVKEDRLS